MRITALIGPRQTGKTTAAIHACRRLVELGYECVYVAVDQSKKIGMDTLGLLQDMDTVPNGAVPDLPWMVELWERIRPVAFRSSPGVVLVLDEVQLIPYWSRIVKGLWDADRRIQCPIHVVILGPAPWWFFTGRGDSLVGRFHRVSSLHWSYQEMANAFGLTTEEYLFYGGYPGAIADGLGIKGLPNWRNHISQAIAVPKLDKDIMELRRIDQPRLLRHLIELAPHYSGKIWSFDKLANELQGVTTEATVETHIRFLSDVGLITFSHEYMPLPILRNVFPTKLNVLNTALMTARSGYTLEEAKADRSFWGAVVESAVGAHIYNSRKIGTRLHYWRKHDQIVDFVVERGPHLLGIAVNSGSPRRRTGLAALVKNFPKAKTLIVGAGGVPVDEFLSFSADEWIDKS